MGGWFLKNRNTFQLHEKKLLAGQSKRKTTLKLLCNVSMFSCLYAFQKGMNWIKSLICSVNLIVCCCHCM